MKKRSQHIAAALLAALAVQTVSLTSCSTDTAVITRADENSLYVAEGDKEVRIDFLSGAAEEEKTDEKKTDEEKNRAYVVNVRDFGAVGDGETNDTKAIQKALNSVREGGVVYIPAGTYIVSRQLYIYSDAMTVKGDGKATVIHYNYKQLSSSTAADAALFGTRDGITDLVMRDMKLEYEGEFFPNFGDSYKGAVSGIYLPVCHNVLIENIETTGFNADGVNVAGKSGTYATNVTIRGCYMHHNRVGGVLYGYVDGILLEDNIFEYMGSQPDGGTGYGCAGYSGAYPKNVRVIHNQCNYNYRKGIDLHAGENVIIEGNTCKGNRLYGIYAEGALTKKVIIRNNVISDMYRDKLDIGAPYTWLSGIDVGTASDKAGEYFDFEIVGNIIENHGLAAGSAYGICGYFAYSKGKVVIKDNVMVCGQITHFMRFSNTAALDSSNDLSFIIEGNKLYADRATDFPLLFNRFNSLIMKDNTMTIAKNSAGHAAELKNDRKASVVIARNNNFELLDKNTSFLYISDSRADTALCENNFRNGKLYE